MPKKPKLRSIARRKKQASSYLKGWETRRQNAADKKAMGVIERLSETPIGPEHFDLKAIGQEMQAANRAEGSGGDAILRTVVLHRDEQLCCFLGDMQALRQMAGIPCFAPFTISRSQIEAIEDFLTEQGYSPFGRPKKAA